MARKGRDGQLFPDLETHLEIFRDLVEIVLELVRGRRPVEGGIVTDGPEQGLAFIQVLAIFSETFSGEGGLVVFLLVDLSLPPLISPCRSAEANERGEGHRLRSVPEVWFASNTTKIAQSVCLG